MFYFIQFIGRYGWNGIDHYLVPYITRIENGKHIKYVLLVIAQTELFFKYLLKLHPKVRDCAYLQTYAITESEAILFEEISTKHLNGYKITEMRNSLIVQLNDLIEYHTYLKLCFYKLTYNVLPWCIEERCGLIRINTDSVLPYCIINKQKYIPYFYFEKKLQAFKSLTIEVDKWNFIYIKFCYLVHGVKHDFNNLHSFLLISIDLIKNNFESNIHIEEYWPTCTNDLLNNNITNINPPVPFPSNATEITSVNLSPESSSVQNVPTTNITETDFMVRVKYVINFI